MRPANTARQQSAKCSGKEHPQTMYGLSTTTPITPPDISAINLPGILISIGVGVAVWLVASFVIAGITKRVAAGTTFFKKPHFRWVAPALRALDHERRSSGPTPSARCSTALAASWWRSSPSCTC